MYTAVIEYSLVGVICFAVASARYLLMCGAYYAIVYKWMAKRLWAFKIEKRRPTDTDVRTGIKWGLLNNVNYATVGMATYWMYEQGWLKLYFDLDQYGLLYAIAIVPVLLIIHDAYFFWSHYLMHRKVFRKQSRHVIHHEVHNVSPWSAFSVHPVEGFIEMLIRPAILLTIPLHPATLVVFGFITFALNVIGHSGYEFFPSGYTTSPLTRLNSSATFHYLHHKNGKYNFGLFLCVWDRMMGTMHPDYERLFEQTARANPLKLPQAVGPELLKPASWANG